MYNLEKKFLYLNIFTFECICISPDEVFSEQAISIIEEWQPRDRVS